MLQKGSCEKWVYDLIVFTINLFRIYLLAQSFNLSMKSVLRIGIIWRLWFLLH